MLRKTFKSIFKGQPEGVNNSRKRVGSIVVIAENPFRISGGTTRNMSEIRKERRAKNKVSRKTKRNAR